MFIIDDIAPKETLNPDQKTMVKLDVADVRNYGPVVFGEHDSSNLGTYTFYIRIYSCSLKKVYKLVLLTRFLN